MHVVINARTDNYLFAIGTAETRLDDTLKRARAYLEAGADCIFVPGVLDPALIQVLVREIPGPINILAGPGAPSASELFKLGVARISVGSSAMTAVMGYIRDIARELREKGTYEQIAAHTYSYAEATRLFLK
ncbi:MAG: isocitrate lyase/phosphoenolpyruvate mutase family protein [Anaerolineae bacterium]